MVTIASKLCRLRGLPTQPASTIIYIGLTLPFIRSTNKKRWNFRKANWDEFTAAAEKSIPLIPRHDVPVEEAYSRFNRALLKAAQTAVPRGCSAIYIPCIDEELKHCWRSTKHPATQTLPTN